jgi:hypothetical protein
LQGEDGVLVLLVTGSYLRERQLAGLLIRLYEGLLVLRLLRPRLEIRLRLSLIGLETLVARLRLLLRLLLHPLVLARVLLLHAITLVLALALLRNWHGPLLRNFLPVHRPLSVPVSIVDLHHRLEVHKIVRTDLDSVVLFPLAVLEPLLVTLLQRDRLVVLVRPPLGLARTEGILPGVSTPLKRSFISPSPPANPSLNVKPIPLLLRLRYGLLVWLRVLWTVLWTLIHRLLAPLISSWKRNMSVFFQLLVFSHDDWRYFKFPKDLLFL